MSKWDELKEYAWKIGGWHFIDLVDELEKEWKGGCEHQMMEADGKTCHLCGWVAPAVSTELEDGEQ